MSMSTTTFFIYLCVLKSIVICLFSLPPHGLCPASPAGLVDVDLLHLDKDSVVNE